MAADQSAGLAETVRQAAAARTPLAIAGAGSRPFLGHAVAGQPLSLTAHSGVVAYEPRELVITARSGTTLAELEALLADSGQMLAFEPPRFSAASTLGGMVASGLAGPRRPQAGAVRDFVLGCRMLNGRGELLRFGGQVMKNVAGYDVSRLMVGAYGTLGVLLEVSLKVLPQPPATRTLVHSCDATQALSAWASRAAWGMPLDASCHVDGQNYLRFSGDARVVSQAAQQWGGSLLQESEALRFWQAVRDMQHPFFKAPGALWRISVPATTPMLPLAGDWMLEWQGAQRWLLSDAPAAAIRAAVAAAGGHASLLRPTAEVTGTVFHPLPQPLLALHRQLKLAFDPQRILNPGRMYAEI